MLFNSLSFMLFFAAVLTVYHAVEHPRARKATLVGASYAFYGAWNPFFIPLLLFSTLSDWWLARRIETAGSTAHRRGFLAASLGVNLLLLGYFKYGGWLLESFAAWADAFGLTYAPPAWDIVLPVGISFYTFQTLSYTIDVYRGRMPATRSLLDFSLFVSLFCQLVAGPIVRARDFLPQLRSIGRRIDPENLAWGLTLVVGGLFGKVIMADGVFAPFVDAFYGDLPSMGTLEAWTAAFAFSGQIYCDFAAYSAIAIGAAMCLGLSLPDNFRAPYAATGFSDFWRRWHISLSTWLRDYLYISLGGNRRGAQRTAFNLMITMLLGGLWHGASWTFVAWGALHGGYLGVERLAKHHAPAWMRGSGPRRTVVYSAATFVVISATWVFFRSPDFATAFAAGRLLFVPTEAPLPMLADSLPRVLCAVLGVLGWHLLTRDTTPTEWASRTPVWGRGALIAIALVLLVYGGGGRQDGFIYFQF